MEPISMSRVCFFLGIGSVFGSLLFWLQAKGRQVEDKARAERLALFVGLWAPSMFALAACFRVVARP